MRCLITLLIFGPSSLACDTLDRPYTPCSFVGFHDKGCRICTRLVVLPRKSLDNVSNQSSSRIVRFLVGFTILLIGFLFPVSLFPVIRSLRPIQLSWFNSTELTIHFPSQILNRFVCGILLGIFSNAIRLFIGSID